MRYLIRLILLTLAWLPAGTIAEVQPSLEVQTYPVTWQAGTPLREAINAATPVRHLGRVFHGFTRWKVDWQLWWLEAPGGRCSVQRTLTRVSGVITLPALVGAPAEEQRAFNTYVTALRQHEMGHYQFGLDAAHRIDIAIAALPPEPTCAGLQASANALGRRLLQEAIRAEQEYDRSTRHGRTQGVVLER